MSSPFERLPKTPPPRRGPEPTQGGPLQHQPSPTPEFGAATQAGRARLPLSPTTTPPPDARIGFRLLSVSGTDVPTPRMSASDPTNEPGGPADASTTPPAGPVEPAPADAVNPRARSTPRTPVVRRTEPPAYEAGGTGGEPADPEHPFDPNETGEFSVNT